jgi:hypothetical protein
MKRSYRYGLSCLNIPFLSVFLLLLPSLKVQAEEKSTFISQNNRQVINNSKYNYYQQLAQQNKTTRVIGIDLQQTEQGLEVILQTSMGSQKLVPLILPDGGNRRFVSPGAVNR